jgi:hypothetical protein
MRWAPTLSPQEIRRQSQVSGESNWALISNLLYEFRSDRGYRHGGAAQRGCESGRSKQTFEPSRNSEGSLKSPNAIRKSPRASPNLSNSSPSQHRPS